MDYLSELDRFVLTNDPLVHIIKWLYCPDLYSMKHVSKFYNMNSTLSREIKMKKELKKNLVIEKLKQYENTDPFHYSFFYKFLTLMKYDTINNINIDYFKPFDDKIENLCIRWNKECYIFITSYKSLLYNQCVNINIFRNKTVKLLFNNKKSASKHSSKLRKFFNELNDDNFISIVKKYYLQNRIDI